MTTSVQTSQEHLATLWTQAKQDATVEFLRQVVGPEQTFGELEQALAFAAQHGDLSAFTLQDILAPQLPAAPYEGSSDAVDVGPENEVAKSIRTRRRRKPQATQAIKELVMERLAKAPHGIFTPDLGDAVRQSGYIIENQKLNLLLNLMRNDGQIICDDGRPKTWRTKVQGRTSAEPMMVIRKATAPIVVVRDESINEPAAPALSAASNSGAPARDSNSLMSQSEVQAAAAALRERFFASKNVP